VKTGIRQVNRGLVLILDADGQHHPSVRCDRGRARRVICRRRLSSSTASGARRVGNAVLNATAGYLAEPNPRPDLGLPGGAPRHLLEFSISFPRILDADDDHAGISTGRLQRHFEPIDAACARAIRKIRPAPTAFSSSSFFKVITIFSPMRIFLPLSAASLALGGLHAVWTISTQSHVTIHPCC
jgi:hypothetical protein